MKHLNNFKLKYEPFSTQFCSIGSKKFVLFEERLEGSDDLESMFFREGMVSWSFYKNATYSRFFCFLKKRKRREKVRTRSCFKIKSEKKRPAIASLMLSVKNKIDSLFLAPISYKNENHFTAKKRKRKENFAFLILV